MELAKLALVDFTYQVGAAMLAQSSVLPVILQELIIVFPAVMTLAFSRAIYHIYASPI
jgi:hypothetical protein